MRTVTYLTAVVGPIDTLSSTVHSCINCAQAAPTNDYYVDGAYACARALGHLVLSYSIADVWHEGKE
jgi:hypothetical protein